MVFRRRVRRSYGRRRRTFGKRRRTFRRRRPTLRRSRSMFHRAQAVLSFKKQIEADIFGTGPSSGSQGTFIDVGAGNLNATPATVVSMIPTISQNSGDTGRIGRRLVITGMVVKFRFDIWPINLNTQAPANGYHSMLRCIIVQSKLRDANLLTAGDFPANVLECFTASQLTKYRVVSDFRIRCPPSETLATGATPQENVLFRSFRRREFIKKLKFYNPITYVSGTDTIETGDINIYCFGDAYDATDNTHEERAISVQACVFYVDQLA